MQVFESAALAAHELARYELSLYFDLELPVIPPVAQCGEIRLVLI